MYRLLRKLVERFIFRNYKQKYQYKMNEQHKIQIRSKNNMNKVGQSRTSAHRSFETVDKKQTEFTYSQIHIPSNQQFRHCSMLQESNQSNKYTNRLSQQKHNLGIDLQNGHKNQQYNKSKQLSQEQYQKIANNQNYMNQGHLSTDEEKGIQLQERLKNLHRFYQIRINQQKQKNLLRDQTIIQVLEDMQETHNKKILEYQEFLNETENQRKEISSVDHKVGNIKKFIEDVLLNSKDIKKSNENLQQKLITRSKIIKEKRKQSLRLKQTFKQLRKQLQDLQRSNLKQSKKNRQMLGWIDCLGKN